MIKTMSVRLTGQRPLLMNNPVGADPLHPLSKERKQITSKKSKTDADQEALAFLDYKTGLYTDENGRPMIPSRMIEGALVGGAKKKKMGPQAKAGIVITETKFIYDGPDNLKDLYADPTFMDRSRVKQNGGKSIMKIRPKFPKWAVEAMIEYNDELVNESEIVDMFKAAGEQCGIGDWRPQHGTFKVEKL